MINTGRWKRSSYGGDRTNCVEVGRTGDGTAVRDSKGRSAGYFTTTCAQCSTLLAAVKADRFA